MEESPRSSGTSAESAWNTCGKRRARSGAPDTPRFTSISAAGACPRCSPSGRRVSFPRREGSSRDRDPRMHRPKKRPKKRPTARRCTTISLSRRWTTTAVGPSLAAAAATTASAAAASASAADLAFSASASDSASSLATSASPKSRCLRSSRRASSSKRIPRKPHVSSSSLAAVAVASLFLVSQNVLSASLPPVDTAPSSSADTSASTAVETFIRVSAVPDGFSAAAGSSAPPFGLTPKPTSCPPKPKVAPHGLLIHAGAFFIGAFGPGC
mmetsp:Transcript_10174/g.46064  ORF Transcript_10174/g.46064 Transcript_10174/m.46064 type:complete len:270 (+) Transcript_10174:444-1253(+)